MNWQSFCYGVLAAWALPWIVLGLVWALAFFGRSSQRGYDRSRNGMMNVDAYIISRSRQHGPVYVEEPNGVMTPLVGLEQMGDLWPVEIR